MPLSAPTISSAVLPLPLNTFVHGNIVYTSPTRRLFPPRGPPPEYDSPDGPVPSSSTWLSCMWAKADYLELAFYPTSTQLVGSLFQSLRLFRRDEVPCEKQRAGPDSPTRYRCAYAKEWEDLEAILVHVRNILQKQRQVDVLVGLEKKRIPGPSFENYAEWLLDREEAQGHAYYARRKFLYHIAMISFHIAAISHRTRDPHRWYDVLIESGMPGHIVDNLASSVVADFSPNTPRAGVFVDPLRCSWPSYFPILISGNVPVFIAWDSEGSGMSFPPVFKDFMPSPASLPATRQVPHADPGMSPPPILSSSHGPAASSRHRKEGSQSPPTSAEYRSRNARSSGTESYRNPLPRRAPFVWKGHVIPSGGVRPSPPKFVPGSTPGTFFTARAMYREMYIREHENEEQKVARLDREKNAALYQITLKGHDELYEWNFDYNSMQWMRGRITRKDRETVWSIYAPTCKRYDPIAREWDVAYFLDYNNQRPTILEEYDDLLADDDNSTDDDLPSWKCPPVTPLFRAQDCSLNPPPPDYMSDDEEPSGGIGLTEPPLSPPTALTSLPTTTSLAINSTILTPSTTMPTVSPEDGELPGERGEWVPDVPDFGNLITYRIGLRVGSTVLPEPTATKRVTLEEATRAVGFYLTPNITRTLDSPTKTQAFVTLIALIATGGASLPPDWWLLHKMSAHTLRDTLRRSGLDIMGIRDTRQDDPMQWSIREKRQDDQVALTWFIVVADPLTALEVALSFTSLDHASCWMVTFGKALYIYGHLKHHPLMICSGMPFRTLLYSPQATSMLNVGQSGTMPRSQRHIPVRATNHVFSALDFLAYEESRDSLLRSNPRIARAALLAGGILWRLAIEVVVPDIVLEHPGELAYAHGLGFTLLDQTGAVYVDDILTEDEICFIIGTYVREPRERTNIGGFGLPSWWPHPAKFEHSPLGFGWWTPVDEKWYRRFRVGYLNGTEQPKGRLQWQNCIRKWDKRARKVTDNTRDAASEFLRSNMAR
ncbi:hypothetical protein BD309DRAFT_975560 [Dichomitus squalens]|nr:hypothetical protein BD309DRAFT_975560 [Dichomitus squalens]